MSGEHTHIVCNCNVHTRGGKECGNIVDVASPCSNNQSCVALLRMKIERAVGAFRASLAGSSEFFESHVNTKLDGCADGLDLLKIKTVPATSLDRRILLQQFV